MINTSAKVTACSWFPWLTASSAFNVIFCRSGDLCRKKIFFRFFFTSHHEKKDKQKNLLCSIKWRDWMFVFEDQNEVERH